MITTPIKRAKGQDGSDVISPAQALPSNAIAVFCDGEKYTVYQVGDVVPTNEGRPNDSLV